MSKQYTPPKERPLEKFSAKCFGCGLVSEYNSKEHPYQYEIFHKKGHVVCLHCGLRFSVPKKDGK